MSMTNAQAALQAAATIAQPNYWKGNPNPMFVHSLASNFKNWLDSQDAVDARDAEVARKGTLDQRVTRLEEQFTPVLDGGAR